MEAVTSRKGHDLDFRNAHIKIATFLNSLYMLIETFILHLKRGRWIRYVNVEPIYRGT